MKFVDIQWFDYRRLDTGPCNLVAVNFLLIKESLGQPVSCLKNCKRESDCSMFSIVWRLCSPRSLVCFPSVRDVCHRSFPLGAILPAMVIGSKCRAPHVSAFPAFDDAQTLSSAAQEHAQIYLESLLLLIQSGIFHRPEIKERV